MEDEDCILSLDERHSLGYSLRKTPTLLVRIPSIGEKSWKKNGDIAGNTRTHTTACEETTNLPKNAEKIALTAEGLVLFELATARVAFSPYFLKIRITTEDCDFERIRFSQRWRQFTNGEHLADDAFCIAETYTKNTQIVHATQSCWFL